MLRPPLRETPSQTAGPYVHLGLAPQAAGFSPFARALAPDLLPEAGPGTRIRVEGTVFDAAAAPVRDALIEVWQADPSGIYPHPDDPRRAKAAPGFGGWARVVPDFGTGAFAFETLRPGPVPGPDGRPMAPHIALWIVARGINLGLSTRIYFADADNTADPVLAAIDPPARRATLIAPREDRAGVPVYRFDIRLAGPGETVFFDV
jgi:protocatechuate 3,4-dioxygenase alpha subunit